MSKISSDMYLGVTEEEDVGCTRYSGAEMPGFPPKRLKTSSLTGLSRWRLTSSKDHSSILASHKRTFLGVMSKSVVSLLSYLADDRYTSVSNSKRMHEEDGICQLSG